FEGDTLTIRERKRVRGKHSTRRVPISETLRSVIDEWMTEHPGGKFLFCMAGLVRSKTRRTKPEPITRDMFHDHFKRALKTNKWKVIAGLHCFRHSLCSNLAAQRTDQRVINHIVGHVSPETVKRYQHLTPKVKEDAISQLFESKHE
ncbi:MAG: site-specific integrase, partial [Planctomycetaceae bacterium]|nr:site-specific integrase [Planctomycetaceae bacterium]